MPLEEPRARYRQLADLIRAGIVSGEFPPGSLLPPENDLVQRYGVSRRTVNRAIVILRGEGLVRVDRGRGTVVRELPVLRRDAVTRQREREHGQARGAFQAELMRLGLEARSEVEVTEVRASADVAEHLGVKPGTAVLSRRRQMYADQTPVQLATSWLPLDIAAGTRLADADSGRGGIYSRLGELGYEPVAFSETVRVRPPDDEEARLLRMDEEQRVLTIRRLATTASGRVVEVNDMVLPAHQWELHYEWTA